MMLNWDNHVRLIYIVLYSRPVTSRGGSTIIFPATSQLHIFETTNTTPTRFISHADMAAVLRHVCRKTMLEFIN